MTTALPAAPSLGPFRLSRNARREGSDHGHFHERVGDAGMSASAKASPRQASESSARQAYGHLAGDDGLNVADRMLPSIDSSGSVGFERMASALENSGDYRVLRRLQPAWLPQSAARSDRFGIFLDVETTGLDSSGDHVIELAMLPFDYEVDGRITAVGDPFVALQDPGIPIPPAVTVLTGITDAMVAGRSIDPVEVSAFAGRAAVIIAHNAAFDRRFCERNWPIFASKPWGCSLREISWAQEGFEGAKLCHIAANFGFFFDGHRAVDDCLAGINILSRRLPKSGRLGLSALLSSARCPMVRLRAVGAPFDMREQLKSRGYRWDGATARKAWFIDLPEPEAPAETVFLRREIYRRDDAEIEAQTVTAWDRYSERC